jgi:flagellar biosynthesis protein FliR
MIVSLAQTQLFILVLTRVAAIMIAVPVLGGNIVPDRIRIAFILLVTAILIPTLKLPSSSTPLDLFPFALAILQELIIGTLAGFAATLTFGAIQIAGEMIGFGAGFNSSMVLNPTFGDSGSSINQFFSTLALLIFLVTNGHHVFLLGLQRTFTVLPVNGGLPPLASAERLITVTTQLISYGIQIALPVAGALLLTDLTLGLLSRVAPQMQVFFLGMPIKLALGLVALSISLSFLLPSISNAFQGLGTRMIHLVGG